MGGPCCASREGYTLCMGGPCCPIAKVILYGWSMLPHSEGYTLCVVHGMPHSEGSSVSNPWYAP